MQDHQNPRSGNVRSKPAQHGAYDVGHLASKHELSHDQARELIERFGKDADKLDAVVARLKARRSGFWGRMAGLR